MLIYLLLLSVLSFTLSLTCNSSSFQFTSDYALGKQDELNRTFTKIEKNLPHLDFDHTFNDTKTTYHITNFTSIFKYLDTFQRSQIVDNDTILVMDGYARLDFSLNWTSNGSSNVTGGIAQGTVFTDEIHFGKNIVINKQGFPMYNLYGFYKLAWKDNMTINRLTPYTERDENALNQILNYLPNDEETLKQHYLAGVNNVYSFYLNESLHEEYHKLQKQFNYTYNHPQKGNLVVPFEHVLLSVNLNNRGLNMNFSTTIKNYNDFDCGKSVPKQSRSTSEFGGVQQFMSLGVYSSTIRYAIIQGYLDSALNTETWQSRHFQFFAGDLYDVIPNLQKKYYPDDKLKGNCKALTNGFSFIRAGTDIFNVSINFNCSLYAHASDKIVDLSVTTMMAIKADAKTNYTDFFVKSMEHSVSYYSSLEYPIVNRQLADYYFNITMHSMIGSRVFGSGFPSQTRDYPQIQINTDYVFIYDSALIHQGYGEY